MSDVFPRWPPDWTDDHTLATDESLAVSEDIEFFSALRSDGQVLFAVAWPEGRRYMLVDPEGETPPRALRVGEKSEDPDIGRGVEGVWSGALALARQILDGEVDPLRPGLAPLPTEDEPKRRRRWRS
jgi:hypothetical protein